MNADDANAASLRRFPQIRTKVVENGLQFVMLLEKISENSQNQRNPRSIVQMHGRKK